MLTSELKKTFIKNENRLAIKDDKMEVTYSRLSDLVEKIKNYLLTKENIKVIGLYMNKNVYSIATILACLFAGKVFLILDPFQEDLINISKAKKSEVDYIITAKKNHMTAEVFLNSNLVKGVEDIENITSGKYEEKEVLLHGDDASYHIYTSGSTFSPKCVVQNSDAIMYYANAYINEIGLNEEDRVAFVASMSHDAMIIDVFSTLLSGACLCLFNEKDSLNLLKVSSWIEKNNITIWHSVPTIFREAFKNYNKIKNSNCIRRVVLGGEIVRVGDYSIFEKISCADSKMYNLYGQTEASYSMGRFILCPNDCKEIGVPIKGTSIIIKDGNQVRVIERGNNEAKLEKDLDLSLKEQLVDAEIVVKSRFVSDEYLNVKTIPFYTDSEGYKYYKTGDYVKINGDCIEYMGRLDNQCKINGNRVELEEVERGILHNKKIHSCVVVPMEKHGKTKLVACLKSDCHITITDINEELKSMFPRYIKIFKIINMDCLPKTTSGKVNRPEIKRLLETQ